MCSFATAMHLTSPAENASGASQLRTKPFGKKDQALRTDTGAPYRE
jgi:hypothetical protein